MGETEDEMVGPTQWPLESIFVEAPIFWSPVVRANSLEKTLMLGKIKEEKGTIEDEMAGWHH